MKFAVEKNHFLQAVILVSKAVSTRTAIPILSGIKLEWNGDGLTLTGSDADISIAYVIPERIEEQEIVRIEKEGKVVLPARFLTEIAKKLPGEYVTVEVFEHHLTSIRSGAAEFNLHGLDAEEYPRLPQIVEESSVRVSSMLLKNLIRQTSFAASTSESRPILTGIQWNLENESLIFIATDSHRLSRGRIKVERGMGAEPESVVVPARSLNELNKILEEKDEPVEVVISGNQLLVRDEHLLFYSRLLEGTYPDTSRIVPKDGKTRIRVGTRALYDALDRAALIAASDRNHVVRISTVSSDELEIFSFSPEIGKLSEKIPAASVEGEELKISFNAKYMLEALRVIEEEEVEMGFNGAMSPFTIRPAGNEALLHLIVPVRTY